jgi:hypothetical protein
MLLTELSDKLKDMDEITLLELLNINAEDIVDRFQDTIEDNAEYLIREVEDIEEY